MRSVARAAVFALLALGPRTARAAEPEVPAETPPPPPPPPPPAPPPARKEVVEEVHIVGRRDLRTPTEHRIGREEVRVVPGAFGDPFRALDILPSLVPIISGLPYFYIRGAPPSNVGYYIDEVRVPYLFHFGIGPGVIQPALIEEVALHPAAYPARFGRFAGGIVAGQTREPPAELRGEGQIRVIDAGAYLEAPLLSGRATAGVGGRYSYTAAAISLFAPDTTIDYRDYNARASYRVSDRVQVSALAFGSYDYASNVEQGVEEVLFASEFHRLDLRLDHRGDRSTTRVAATVGLDRTRIEGSRFAQDWVSGARARHRISVSRELEVELGADVLADTYTADVPSIYAVTRENYERSRSFFSPRTDTASGVWTQASLRPAPGWDLAATLRGDVFTSDGEVAFGPSPRLSARVPLVRRVAFLAALGIATQPPAFLIPVPAIGYRGLPGGLTYAYQKSLGAEIALPLRFVLKTVGFHHTYYALRDFGRDREFELDVPTTPNASPSQAFGVEVSLMRKLSERFAAFSSLTLSRSQFGSTATEPVEVAPFDRTHVFQVGGVADLGHGWRTSSRFLTYGGWPLERDATGRVRDRLSGFVRVDLRIEKRWILDSAPSPTPRRWISLVLEGLNVTASKEIVGRSCIGGRCRDRDIGPIVVPSIGVEGGL